MSENGWIDLQEVMRRLGLTRRMVTLYSDSPPDHPDHIKNTASTNEQGHKLRRYRISDIERWLEDHTK